MKLRRRTSRSRPTAGRGCETRAEQAKLMAMRIRSPHSGDTSFQRSRTDEPEDCSKKATGMFVIATSSRSIICAHRGWAQSERC